MLETGTTSLEDCIARCDEGQTTQVPPLLEEVAQEDAFRIIMFSISTVEIPCGCMVDISGEHCKYVVITLAPKIF